MFSIRMMRPFLILLLLATAPATAAPETAAPVRAWTAAAIPVLPPAGIEHRWQLLPDMEAFHAAH
jgi:hypothetical protein